MRVGQLVSTVNEMLERLETLFTSQRRFVADVSHELRTPLTAMPRHLEILRRGAARDPQALDASLAAMEREVNRLVRLASDLLLLAQVEAGVTLRHEPVALDELVLEVVRDLARWRTASSWCRMSPSRSRRSATAIGLSRRC